MKVIYSGLFLTEESKATLLQQFKPLHPKVFGDHVTLIFKPTEAEVKILDQYLEKEFELTVIGEKSDVRGHAVSVRIPDHLLRKDPKEAIPHVTISCAEGVTPVYSNELLKTGWETVPNVILKGVVRHFTK
jgi:hypothetical protein